MNWNRIRKKNIYLDHAATTPVDEKVLACMEFAYRKYAGNPSSLHADGVQAKRALEDARKSVADFFGAVVSEIVFTNGGTESNNLAVLGFLKALQSQGRILSELHAITTKIEHPSVLEVFRELENEGLSVTYLATKENGVLDVKEIKKALRENTVFVSVMYANNEIGSVQPIEDIARVIRAHNNAMQNQEQRVVFHSDASQALNYLEMDVRKLHVDLLSASGSKIYGPKVGVLYVRQGLRMSNIMYGGGQEHSLRPGTENVSGIVGFAEACKISALLKEDERVRLTELRTYVIEKLKNEFPDAVLNGGADALPNIVNVSFPGIEGEEMVLRLDAKGIRCSARSACKNDDEKSYVVEVLGDGHYPENAVRFSMGRSTSKKDLDYVIKCIHTVLSIVDKSPSY